MQKITSHYDNLQVQESASIDVIKGAYKHLVQKWHPDKHPNDRLKAERITKMLNDAFTVLSDPASRKKHDEWIAEQRNKEQKQDEQKNTYVNSGNTKNEQYAEKPNNSENVSKNKEYIKKPKNKQYFLLFLSVALGVAFVYTLLYGTEAIAPFMTVGLSNGDLLASAFGKVIGVAILPLLLMKFIGNKTGWVSMILCIFFYYHGVKNHVNNEPIDTNDVSNLQADSTSITTDTANSVDAATDATLAANADAAVDAATNKLMLQTQAAEQGNVNAQTNLGLMYANGEGVPKDASLAVKWYSKAAEQGDAIGQFYLGWMYANGEGVPKDASLAVKWYSKAAEQGIAMAQNNLGWMYEMGEGATKDYTFAYAWYNIAAANGETKYAPVNRNNLEKKMSKAEVTEAQRLSTSWKLGKNIELDNSIDQSSGLALLASYNKNMPGILPDFHTGRPTSPITGDPMSDDEVINWLCNYGNEVFQLTNLDAYKIPIQEFLNSPRAKKCAYERQQNN